jgi:hypothetical protein
MRLGADEDVLVGHGRAAKQVQDSLQPWTVVADRVLLKLVDDRPILGLD